jgi:uncharacterized protein (DUF427 family)
VAGALPRYSFPADDVLLGDGSGTGERGTGTGSSGTGSSGSAASSGGRGTGPVHRDPHVAGNVTVPWGAVDAWFEEDERVVVHPRDPYHRVDSFLTSRVVEVRLGSTELARSARAHMLCETGLPPRWYVPRVDVRMAALLRSSTVTECPYKGTAHYWSAREGGETVDDVVWSYEEDVRSSGRPVQWLLAFDDAKVDVVVDGVRQG